MVRPTCQTCLHKPQQGRRSSTGFLSISLPDDRCHRVVRVARGTGCPWNMERGAPARSEQTGMKWRCGRGQWGGVSILQKLGGSGGHSAVRDLDTA